jgi:hypothetical protein
MYAIQILGYLQVLAVIWRFPIFKADVQKVDLILKKPNTPDYHENVKIGSP